jgi:hypothetical protein
VKALENVRTTVKLPEETKRRLEELRSLSKRVEAGEPGAQRELKEALLDSSPEVVARASDVGRRSLHLLAGQLAAGNPLAESAISARLDLMRAEIGGPNPSPLESLLVEKIVAVWMVAELLEVYLSAQLWTSQDRNHRVPASALKPFISWQEQAHRRLLSSIRELARVRKLQSGLPDSQTNVQINVSKGE